MNTASFQVDVTPDDALAFAQLSGDWNPLHTDAEYASRSVYRKPILHGAFSAGLLSRMAGMHLPGRECLLHGMRLKFVAPIIPPARLNVVARQVYERHGIGRIEVSISNASDGSVHVTGSYEYGFHSADAIEEMRVPVREATAAAPVLVTGATGGLGQAVLAQLQDRAIGVTRSAHERYFTMADLEDVEQLPFEQIAGIVHCAWPTPDNERLTRLADVSHAVEHHVAAPLRQALALAQLLVARGLPGAPLILIGSSFAEPGRHNYRMPLYTLAKSLISPLTRILATELALGNKRCVGISFDVIDGGMNQRISEAARIGHTDRVPRGALPDMREAAAQIAWVLDNASDLVSGATIQLTAAAAP